MAPPLSNAIQNVKNLLIILISEVEEQLAELNPARTRLSDYLGSLPSGIEKYAPQNPQHKTRLIIVSILIFYGNASYSLEP
ncbi:hypothetical protein [Pseudomonas citronellolis]|uniref:hypothetical protein n=1 Tax=Pseudomonas citronellolis TaxID=53408 RepID=UPI0012FD6406|nr:hypothetical protein [Pseudomonas citronellolis]